MTHRRSTPLRIATLAAIVTPILAAQALASGPNEYTMSPSEMTPTVTTYQDTYQTQTYQPRSAEPAAPQFGEIVYDTQPYMPQGTGTGTDIYTTQPYQPALQAPQPTYAPIVTN